MAATGNPVCPITCMPPLSLVLMTHARDDWACLYPWLPAQWVLSQGPNMEQQLQPFPKVREWVRRMQEETEPHFSAVHQVLQKATANAVKWKGSMDGRSKL